MIIFDTEFKRISMAGADKHYETVVCPSVECDTIRIIYDRSQQVETVSDFGALPSSMSMGIDPKTVRLLVSWNKTAAEMQTYAASLGRVVSCVNNIFMPGMIVTISGDVHGSAITGKWYVDTWSTNRTNARGKKFDGEVTLIEYTDVDNTTPGTT